MVNNSILEVMIKDHKKIINLLDDVEKNRHLDFDVFCKFKWHLEKHLFVEEKAIFNSPQIGNGIEEKILKKLSNEHTVIIELLDKILRDSFPKGNLNFHKLKHLLAKHRKFEENEIYPKIDEKLNENEKNEIIKKITEIV